MRKIKEIYQSYKLISGLQLHQLRVAAVAWQICDSLKADVDTETIVKACLLHDMGNIIKSDLTIFPDFIKEEGIEYWQKVQADFIAKYGADEHHATIEIAKELGMSQNVLSNIDAIGFRNAIANEESQEIARKICSYSDMRVGPWGILSLDERLTEGEKRYMNHLKKWIFDKAGYEMAIKSLHNLEKQILGMTDLEPEDITDQSIKPYLEKLENYQL